MASSRTGGRANRDNLSAHDYRHYWTTAAIIKRKVDPFTLLQAGGWTSMSTVQKYVDETARPMRSCGVLVWYRYHTAPEHDQR